VFHFFLPFLLLLSRRVKRRVPVLASLAAALLVIRLLDLFWTVEPAFDRTAVHFHWLDWAAVFGLGGIWLAAFVRQLKNRPLLPIHDPRLREILEQAGAHE
jgi:peptidoglycan/LPS O-acetylase OafA/YrhL